MEVTVYGQLRSATGEKQVSVDFDGGTARDALDALIEQYPGTERHLLDEDGQPVPSVRVTRDGEVLGLDEECPADASLAVHPAMRGG